MTPPLATVLEALARRHGTPAAPPAAEPFALIAWMLVGHLVDAERHAHAFDLLRRRVGLDPALMREAPERTLHIITAEGGAVGALVRAHWLHACAELALEAHDGDLARVARQPVERARAAFAAFPGLGLAGADFVLLFSGAHPVLALDAHGVRTLLRLGYGPARSTWDATYLSVQASADPGVPAAIAPRQRAHLLLRTHGLATCHRVRPNCGGCVVAEGCGWRGR